MICSPFSTTALSTAAFWQANRCGLVVLRAAERAPETFPGLVIAGGTARFPKSLQLRTFRLGLRVAYRLTLRNVTRPDRVIEELNRLANFVQLGTRSA